MSFPLPSFPHHLLMSMKSYGMGYLSGQLGSSVLVMSPSKFYYTYTVCERENILTLFKHFSAVTKTLSLHYKRKIQFHTSCYEEKQLFQPQPYSGTKTRGWGVI